MSNIRAFIAIELSEGVKEKLTALEDELKGSTDKVAWVKPESIHLTLKFLGSIESEKINAIENGLQSAAEGIKRFSIELGGVGCFPNLKNPRVIWVGVKENAKLSLLNKNIEEHLEKLGFERETKAFHAHLTLCRVRDFKESKKLSEMIRNIKTDVSAHFTAENVILFKSELKKEGALHTPIKTIILSKGDT